MKPPNIVTVHFLSTKWSKKLFTINHYEPQNSKCIVTQELSAYENDIASIPIDVLIAMSEYFKVSTDYILGLSDERYNLKMQMTFNKEVDEYYEIIELYKRLDTKNKKLVFHILTKMNELMADKKG